MTDHAPDWPLGAVLRAAREELGLAIREAGRRADISDTLWRTLERGYETRRGEHFPAKPRADTVARAAIAVRLPVAEALRLSGHRMVDLTDDVARLVPSLAEEPDLSRVSDDHLLAEVRRRMGTVSPVAPTVEEIEADPQRFKSVRRGSAGDSTSKRGS